MLLTLSAWDRGNWLAALSYNSIPGRLCDGCLAATDCDAVVVLFCRASIVYSLCIQALFLPFSSVLICTTNPVLMK